MSVKPVSTKEFAKCLRELRKKGKEGKNAIMKAHAAQAEIANDGKITSLARSKHGETRIPNVEKFEISDDYRLVTQIISADLRAFLFVGDHGDTDRWLDNHKNYKWVKRDADQTLEFIQVSNPQQLPVVATGNDLDSPQTLLELPLLRDLSDDQWKAARIPNAAVLYLKTITAESWEIDPNGIIGHIEQLAHINTAILAADLLTHAHQREWDQMHRRIGIEAGGDLIVEGVEAADAMLDPSNSETFITWEDIAELPPDADWVDWMLFMHPEQKEYALRSFNGPARLRGVSGSGKTCVMIHRARRLAKQYQQDVLLVTLTESMRRLLDILVKMLCGAEAAHIRTSTMNALAEDAIDALAVDGLKSFTKADNGLLRSVQDAAIKSVRSHPKFSETVLSKIPSEKFEDFIVDEIRFVRMRFLAEEYEKYSTTKRHGRTIPLPAKARDVILTGVHEWDQALKRRHAKDYEGVVQHALALVSQSSTAAKSSFCYRCVLVDEVQDLSQAEMRMLAKISDSTGKAAVDLENGLFLVGDGAQSIYSRGFTLKNCGVSVANRSFVLQKNYRNTKEILQAAYGLIKSYEFADVDEENIATPTKPHLSSRHGERPSLVKATNWEDESSFVVAQIKDILKEQRSRDDADELETDTEIPICIIGFTRRDRRRIETALRKAQVPVAELREDVAWKNHAVKISTLESAKGHEFHAVFIVGVNQGIIPQARLPESEWKREAARLYVGMTRARDRLFMSYVISEGQSPSRFLAAVQSDCNEVEWKRGTLNPVE